MSNKKIYGIYDNETGTLYPDTHLFVLDNEVKAIYSLCVFAGKLNDTNISLRSIGEFDNESITSTVVKEIVSFDKVPLFIKSFPENYLISAGFNYKSFIHHYNIIISNINNFRRSLLSDVNNTFSNNNNQIDYIKE